MQKIKATLSVLLCVLSMQLIHAQLPGNVRGVTPIVWLTPDGYSNGTWTNRISGTTGNFVRPSTSGTVAPAIAAGYNYHPAVVFTKSSNSNAQNRLLAQNAVSIATTDNVTTIFVLKRKTGSYADDDLFAFRNGSSNEGNLVWNSSTSGIMSFYWGGSSSSSDRLNTACSANEGIICIDNANNSNTTTGGINFYSNGQKMGATVSSGNSTAYNNQNWVIGAGYDNNLGYGYEGQIQEVIILKAQDVNGNVGNTHVADSTLSRLHSYLAIKYGVSLLTNYVNASGQVVWNRDENTGYNEDIFGIANDEIFPLHQKQGTSAKNSLFTAFVGIDLMPLNSQNTSVALSHGMYVMFGSSGGDFNATVAMNLPNPAVPSQTINYRKATVYKVRMTGCQVNTATGKQTIKLKLKQTEGKPLPEYVLISSSPDFPADQTRIIPWRGHTIEEELTDGYYIALAGHQAVTVSTTPAGISSDKLRMWLDASNTLSITSTNEDLSTSILTGYPGDYSRATYVQPVNNRLNTVREWRDPIRNVKYELSNSSTLSAGRRIPVYSATPPEMNYHPAVQFWGTSARGTANDFGAYLSNTTGIFSSGAPQNNEHTAIFVVNNYTPTYADRSYYMGFGREVPSSGADNHAPTYGIKMAQNKASATMNTSADGKTSSNPLEYTTGSTAIMAYRTHGTGSASNHRVTFGINGQSMETRVLGLTGIGTLRFNQPSMLGVGYNQDRQLNGLIAEALIFEKKLDTDTLRLVEAYLAVKYGITLRETASLNYDYKMQDDLYPGGVNTYWPGKSRTPYSQFHNNVAAIIRDDASNLYNRQSHSTEVGSMLHVGIGGIPEAELDKNGIKSVIGAFDNDKEVVVWGHNDNNGSDKSSAFYTIDSTECSRFSNVFKRRWLLHKSTKDDHPMQLLIGLQDNTNNNLGSGADNITQALYDKLHGNNELYMMVATSMADIDSLIERADVTKLKAIVPMTYANNEFQCSYKFTDSIYYITFGVRTITEVCTGSKEFAGKKTFEWTQYASNSINSASTAGKNFDAIPFDLGDEITGKTHITYGAGVTAPRYYPSTLGAPGNGITIRRTGGSVNSNVTIEIEFDAGIVVKPEFRISGIDEYSSRYERVHIVGYCDHSMIAPKFMPVSSSPGYNMDGLYSLISKSGARGPNDSNGAVDVSFPQGVRRIVIEYTITGLAPNSTNRNIYISPISCTSASIPPPPPPVNEDGLGFTEEVNSHEVSTCETVQYSFYITNANYGHKVVNFSDVLPVGLKWKEASVAIDTLGFADKFPHDYSPTMLAINNYEGRDSLRIDSIFVPCNSTMKLTAVAEIDSLFAENTILPAFNHTYEFANRSGINYEIEKDHTRTRTFTQSVDRQTLDTVTVFTATYQHLNEPVKIETSVNPSQYTTNGLVTVKLKLTNNNPDINGVFLNVQYGAGFRYVNGSYSANPNTGSVYIESPAGMDTLSFTVVGSAAADLVGFQLPTGVTEFTFQLRAPNTVEPEYDVTGTVIPNSKAALNISYDFSSNNKDVCLRRVLNLSDVLRVPFRAAPTHVIINSHLNPTTY